MSDEKPRYLFISDDELSAIEQRVNEEAAAGYRLLQFQACAEAHWDTGYPRTTNGTETWYYAVMELVPVQLKGFTRVVPAHDFYSTRDEGFGP